MAYPTGPSTSPPGYRQSAWGKTKDAVAFGLFMVLALGSPLAIPVLAVTDRLGITHKHPWAVETGPAGYSPDGKLR